MRANRPCAPNVAQMNLQDFLKLAPADIAEHLVPPCRVLQLGRVSRDMMHLVQTTKFGVDVRPASCSAEEYAHRETTNGCGRRSVDFFVAKSIEMTAKFHIRSLWMHDMHVGSNATFAEIFERSPRLEVVSLHNNRIDEELLRGVFAAIPSSVRILKLSRQWVNHKAVAPLCDLLKRLVLMEELDLSENYLSSHGMEALTASISSPYLRRVALGYNHLKSRFWNEHPDLGFSRFTLQSLDLQHNMLQGVFCDSIFSCVRGSARALTTLDLSYNDLRLLGMSYLSASLQHCYELRHLNIAGNMCGDAGFALVLSALSPFVPAHDATRCAPLQSLDVASNELTAASARLFARWLSDNRRLEDTLSSFSFSYNDLNDAGAQGVLQALLPCKMKRLGLAQCKLSEIAGLRLAGIMLHWRELSFIDVHANSLCIMSLALITNALCQNNSNAKKMMLAGNRIDEESTLELAHILACAGVHSDIIWSRQEKLRDVIWQRRTQEREQVPL